MTTTHVFLLGLSAGMLLDQGLLWLQKGCERYSRRRFEHKENDEFWSGAMTRVNIEYCLDQGMDLVIAKGPRGDYIAEVRTPQIKRHAAGKSIEAAMEALEQLLTTVGPKP